jgi:hypothetical protein
MAEPTQDTPQALIEGEVIGALDLQKSLEDMQNELMQNEKFRQFLELSKTVPAQIDAAWKQIEAQMIEHNIKSLKGDYGSITIAEKLAWDTTDELPAKFYKKTVDTKKLSDTYRLEGRAPKGATPKTSKYLTKRLK